MNLEEIYTKHDNLKYIEDLVSFLIDKYKLEDYVKELNIDDEFNESCNANYNPYYKKLNLYLYSTKVEFGTLNHYIYRMQKGSKEYNDNYSLFLVKTILHELTHAFQYKELELNKNDSIHSLLKEEFDYFSNGLMNVKDEIFYKLFYGYVLVERNAKCNSKRLLLELNNEHKFIDDNNTKHLENEYKKALNSRYSIICPCKKYYMLRNKIDEYNSISFDENYDIETRKSWGMKLIK